MLIPIQCEYYALEGLAQLLKTVELVTSHLNPTLAVTTVLLTMYDSRTQTRRPGRRPRSAATSGLSSWSPRFPATSVCPRRPVSGRP